MSFGTKPLNGWKLKLISQKLKDYFLRSFSTTSTTSGINNDATAYVGCSFNKVRIHLLKIDLFGPGRSERIIENMSLLIVFHSKPNSFNLILVKCFNLFSLRHLFQISQTQLHAAGHCRLLI
jgi:hypothetical protein